MLRGSCTLAWASSSEVKDATLGGSGSPAEERDGPGGDASWGQTGRLSTRGVVFIWNKTFETCKRREFHAETVKQHSEWRNQRQKLQKQHVSCQKLSKRGKVLFVCREEADEVFRDYITETGGTQLLTLCTTSKLDLETPALGFSHASLHFVWKMHWNCLSTCLNFSDAVHFFVIGCDINCFNAIHSVNIWLFPCIKVTLNPPGCVLQLWGLRSW